VRWALILPALLAARGPALADEAADLAATALEGDVQSQYALGEKYLRGDGVPQDDARAIRSLRLAADQGFALAQYRLGELYETGRGVPQSNFEAAVCYRLATSEENAKEQLGAAIAEQAAQKQAAIEQKLSAQERSSLAARVADVRANVAVHPRKFGFPGGLGPSRGWYVWHSWNPETWEAVVSRDPPKEKWTVRVLPWATTYRYGVYGVRPDALLRGEKLNIFFNPDGREPRKLLVHFQDEVSQMKGHGHYWQVREVAAAAQPPGFTARIMAGEQPLGSPEVTFVIDPKCRTYRGGASVEPKLPAVGDKLYLTWVYREDRPTVMLMTDEASLKAIQDAEEARVAKEIAAEGMAGRLEMIEGATVYGLVFSSYWSQARALKPGVTVQLVATDRGFHPAGVKIEGKVAYSKNRGTYGSGATDLVVELTSPNDAKLAREWLDGRVIRVIP
jgi:hypothetical protein